MDIKLSKWNIYSYDWILFGNKKKESTGTYYSMDEPWKQYAKWKKSVTNDNILFDFSCMKCPEEANL